MGDRRRKNRQKSLGPADINNRRALDPVQNPGQRVLRLFFQAFQQIVNDDEFRFQQQRIGNPDAGLFVRIQFLSQRMFSSRREAISPRPDAASAET